MDELQLYLLRYGEIGTKSLNIRKHFEKILIQNIERFFLSEEAEVITERKGRGRLFAYADPQYSYLFSRVFGIVSFSRAEKIRAELEDMKEKGKNFASEIKGSFAVRARRVGEHEFDSQDVEAEIGDIILDENASLNVDLDDPDHTFYIEIRHSDAYIFKDIIYGPGGLPLSSQGKVAAYVESKDDFIATWLLMRRGARPYVYTPGSSWVKRLNKWDPNLKIRETKSKRTFLDENFPKDVKGLVLGEDLQNLTSGHKDFLIFRPLIGLSQDRKNNFFRNIEKLEKNKNI